MLSRTKSRLAEALSAVRALSDELEDVFAKAADPPGEFSRARHGVRADAMEAMDLMTSEVEQLLTHLAKAAAGARMSQSNQTKQLVSWAEVVSKPPRREAPVHHRARGAPPPSVVADKVGDVTLVARSVDHLEQVGPDLCYVPSLNRYAVRAAGELLVGNVGTVYDVCADPERVKECRFGGVSAVPSADAPTRTPHCQKMGDGQCRYYHDPRLFPASRAPRNFFSTCGQYAPAGTANGGNPNYCRYGSRPTLYQDMARLTAEEARRFQDYVAHLFLCWVILKRERPHLI